MGMGMDTVSVIVCIYGVEAYLPECVNSLIEQTYKDLDIILVDDGSQDRCGEICDFYAEKDARIRVIHKINGGLVSARKVGLEVVTGRYVTYVDGDDWLLPDAIASLVFNGEGADIIAGGLRMVRKGAVQIKGNAIDKGYYNAATLLVSVYPSMISGPKSMFNITPSLCGKLIDVDLLRNNYKRISDGITLGEDAVVTYACLLQANSVYISDVSGYMYRQNDFSMTKAYNGNLKNNLNTLIETMWNIRDQWKGKYDIKDQLLRYILFVICLSGQNELIRSSAPFSEKVIVIDKQMANPFVKMAFREVTVSRIPISLVEKCGITLLKERKYRAYMCIMRTDSSIRKILRKLSIVVKLVYSIRTTNSRLRSRNGLRNESESKMIGWTEEK